jgi:hypothetical protein
MGFDFKVKYVDVGLGGIKKPGRRGFLRSGVDVTVFSVQRMLLPMRWMLLAVRRMLFAVRGMLFAA